MTEEIGGIPEMLVALDVAQFLAIIRAVEATGFRGRITCGGLEWRNDLDPR